MWHHRSGGRLHFMVKTGQRRVVALKMAAVAANVVSDGGGGVI
jgi:hypothetical protein